MTVCVVYVGDLDNPRFKWEGGDWNGNVPPRLSPEFPPRPQHYNGDFHAWVQKTRVECKQTDFGGWTARVTKSQIAEFIAEVYRGDEELPWVKDGLIELNAFVDTLDGRRVYALVATEW